MSAHRRTGSRQLLLEKIARAPNSLAPLLYCFLWSGISEPSHGDFSSISSVFRVEEFQSGAVAYPARYVAYSLALSFAMPDPAMCLKPNRATSAEVLNLEIITSGGIYTETCYASMSNSVLFEMSAR